MSNMNCQQKEAQSPYAILKDPRIAGRILAHRKRLAELAELKLS